MNPSTSPRRSGRSILAVATWNAGPEFDPHGRPVTRVVSPLPGSWLGGAWHAARARATGRSLTP